MYSNLRFYKTKKGVKFDKNEENKFLFCNGADNIMLMDSLDDGDGTGSDGIPGFDPFLIVGVISIVSLVLLKKRMRK